MSICNYNKKVFVVRGNEGEIKPDEKNMKRLKGRWNTNLKGGPAWIFPNSERLNVTVYMERKQLDDCLAECSDDSQIDKLLNNTEKERLTAKIKMLEEKYTSLQYRFYTYVFCSVILFLTPIYHIYN